MSIEKELRVDKKTLFSDDNCDRSYCNLKLGFSSAFDLQIKTFRLSKRQRKNYLKNTFSCQNGQKILNKCEQQINAHYEDVLNGNKTTLVTFPPIFQYNKRISNQSSAWLDQLNDKVKNLKVKDQKELSSIQKFLENVCPQTSEKEIYSGILNCFFNYCGVLIHGFEPNKYLDAFVTHAKRLRELDKKGNLQCFVFNSLEKDILKALNIELSAIKDQVEIWINEISNSTSSVLPLSGNAIITRLDSLIKKKVSLHHVIRRSRSKFKKNQYYSLNDIRWVLSYAIYENVVKPNAEMDFWLVLGSLKTMINIEVKKQMKHSNQTRRNLNRSLRSAAEQTSSHSEYMARTFGPMLSEGWQFLKIAAIFPGELNDEKICPHCRSFIIKGEENISSQLHCILSFVLESQVIDENESFEDFKAVFQAVIGFSSISAHQLAVGNAWQQVQGDSATLFSAGWTESESPLTNNEIRFENILNQPHDIYKFIYFNPDQVAMLEQDIPLVILANDFGAGFFI